MSSVQVPYAPASAALVRHRMSAELGDLVTVDVLDAAVLVVSELVGNAVRHGQALPGGGLLASWELVDGDLRVQVVDGGPGPEVRAAGGPRPLLAPLEAETGRGLELVEALALRWGSLPWHPGPGTAVWADLR